MLIDNHGRRIDYLRLSVTDRCDLRCGYCLPPGFKEFHNRKEQLTIDEMEHIVTVFAVLGVSHLRLTGGEPLVRSDIVDVVERLSRISGLTDLSLSTNATRLETLARPLHEAGIRRVNISLDTLKPARFAAITGACSDLLLRVLAGIDAAADAGMHPIKINTVVMGGINDDELFDIAAYCIVRGYSIRFIETMPMGEAGKKTFEHYIDLTKVQRSLDEVFELIPDDMIGNGPARYWRVAGTETRIGFITPISRHFCETCNRLRVGADGMLYPCLGDIASHSLRPALDSNDGQLLESLIHRSLEAKPLRHHFGSASAEQQPLRSMARTGG